MNIARFYISIGETGRTYNTPQDLESPKQRGDTLANGHVLIGAGTSFTSLQAKERFDRLTKEMNKFRAALHERFIATDLFTSGFVTAYPGEGREFLEEYRKDNPMDPDIVIQLREGVYFDEVQATEAQILQWEEDIKAQIAKVRLGRKKGQVDAEALVALEKLANCPALTPETAGTIRMLVGQWRAGGVLKDDFQRSIAMVPVKVNTDVLSGPNRARPIV